MQVIYKKNDLEQVLSGLRSGGKTIGFVPTMGALHSGHISLIARSKQDTDVTVCSIFVNPTQFNDPNDLKRYPRTPENDILLLEKGGCDILFMPGEQEIYPEKDTRVFDFGYLDKVLDGAARPGHFNGVGQVVSLLFGVVKPDKAFFGQKDYQQVMIIRELVKQLHLQVEIVACPILREADGLAMSSRNALLTIEERQVAGLIPVLMNNAVEIARNKGIEAAKSYVSSEVSREPLMKPDYFEICNAATLEPLTDMAQAPRHVALIACFVGKIRLIDNLVF